MKAPFSLAAQLKHLLEVPLRFPITFAGVIVLVVMAVMTANEVGIHISLPLWMFIIGGIPFSLALTLWLEDWNRGIWKFVIALIVAVIWFFYCRSLPELDDVLASYQTVQLFVINMVAWLAVFVLPFLRKHADAPFWSFSIHVIEQAVLSVAFFGILLLGLLFAFKSIEILFQTYIGPDTYDNLIIICMLLLAPLYFLAHIPGRTEKREEHPLTLAKIYKILGMYILLPLVAIYVLIMYAYLVLILARWELPDGWVSTLVSVLMLGGLIVIAILHPLVVSEEKSKLRGVFRFFGVLAFPLLILMSVGIVRRFMDYGITINRLYILTLNIWFYAVGVYLLVTRARKLKWIVASFALIALLTSVGPWSYANITRRVMAERLTELKSAVGLTTPLSLDELSLHLMTEPADSLQSIQMIDALCYMAENYGISTVSSVLKIDEGLRVWKIRSMRDEVNRGKSLDEIYFAFTTSGITPVDVQGYNKLLFFDAHSSDSLLNAIPFVAICKEMQRKHSKSIDQIVMEKPFYYKEKDRLIGVFNFDGTYYKRTDSVSVNRYGSLEGFILYNDPVRNDSIQ